MERVAGRMRPAVRQLDNPDFCYSGPNPTSLLPLLIPHFPSPPLSFTSFCFFSPPLFRHPDFPHSFPFLYLPLPPILPSPFFQFPPCLTILEGLGLEWHAGGFAAESRRSMLRHSGYTLYCHVHVCCSVIYVKQGLRYLTQTCS